MPYSNNAFESAEPWYTVEKTAILRWLKMEKLHFSLILNFYCCLVKDVWP